MGESGLAKHLGRYVELTVSEQRTLLHLGGATRSYRRGAVIRREHGQSSELLVVQRGWLFCSLATEDGRRQIVRLHYCGDLLGTDMLAFAEAPDATIALTDAELCVIDRERLGAVFTDHPRLAALLFTLQQIDRVTLMDRLVSIGRTSALGRVGALLLWIEARIRTVGPRVDREFTLPLTQEEIGDATGLTAVHVNRTMRVLVEQGLIARSGNRITILNLERLAPIANYIERGERFDTSWMPPAR